MIEIIRPCFIAGKMHGIAKTLKIPEDIKNNDATRLVSAGQARWLEAPDADELIEPSPISDKVARHAEAHGIDTAALLGSGKNGRITKSDIDQIVNAGD